MVTGPVTEVIVPLDKLTRKIKGYGVVTYLIPEHAVKAFTELDGTVFHGRMLHLLPGKAKDSNEPSMCVFSPLICFLCVDIFAGGKLRISLTYLFFFE